jgi:WD40 repeat protein
MWTGSRGRRSPPDGASVLHAAPDNVVTRRDLRTGAVLARYAPALEPHGAVGIAVSPDGRYVAAGHYHGELFVWEVATGAPVLREPFRRANGDADTLWQAKVLAFSPDGDRLATTSSGRLQIVDVRTGRVVARVDTALPSHVGHLRWSGDGRTITLVVGSVVETDSSDGRRPPRADADVLPRVFQWDWQAGTAPVEWTGAQDAAPAAPGR